MTEGRTTDTRAAVVAAALAVGAMVAQVVAGKAARDALFLATFDVGLLPRATATAAFVSVVAALVAARVMAVRAPGRVLPAALAANAVLYAVEWLLLRRAPSVAALTLFGQVAFFGSTLFVALWSLVNESFDPHTAKREVGSIAMGGTLGGALGGLAGWSLGGTGGVPAMLLLLVALNLGCIPAVRVLARRGLRAPSTPATRQGFRAGLASLRSIPYLRHLALLVSLIAATAALLDWVLAARVAATISRGPALVAFFAMFHTSIGILSFLVQALFARVSLERLGLAGSVALSPAMVLLGVPVAILSPSLAAAVLTRGGEAWMTSSLFRAGYELLYTPVPRAQKRPVKMLIDVGLDRLGTAAGSGLVMLVIAFVARPQIVVLAAAAGLAILSLLTALRLHKGYVTALAGSIQRGVVRLGEGQLFDDATRRTLAESSALRREEILARIEEQRRLVVPERGDQHLDRWGDAPALDEPPAGSDPASDPAAEGDDVWPEGHQDDFVASRLQLDLVLRGRREDDLGAALADLRGTEISAIRRQLARKPLEPALVPLALDLLGRDEVARDALHALRGAGPRITGTLVDTLLDPDRDVVVRRRVPRVLESIGSARAAEGLLEGLFVPELEVRHQCAWALQGLVERAPDVKVPRDRVHAAVRGEMERAHALLGAGEDRAVDLQRAVEHCIVLLSAVLEREPLQLAYRALRSGEPGLRGTALEYFENVLPDDMRETALRVLDGLGPRGRSGRSSADLRRELLLSRG